jgi:hypothetical protein
MSYYKTALRRTNNELVDLAMAYRNKCEINVQYTETGIILNIDRITFIISDKYPFQPPDAIINEEPYSKWLTPPSKQIRDRFTVYGIHDIGCYCCHSKLGRRGWSPGCKIKDVLGEINIVRKSKRQIRYIRLLESIFKERPGINESIIMKTMEYLLI